MSAQHSKAVEMDLNALLEILKRDAMLSINCHAIGRIQKFNTSKQTAEVSINYKRVTYGNPGDPPVYVDYPILIDVPVVIMSGGNASLTFPITPGDDCLVLFNDRDIDNWYSSGSVMQPATPRLHSMSDGIAIVGVRSAKNPVSNYDATRVALNHGTTRVAVSATKVKIENSGKTLKEVFNDLFSALDTFFTATSSAMVEPALAPAATAAKAAVAATKTAMEGLLE